MKQIRNIAITTHIDHGKTVLVDQLLYQSDAFRASQYIDDRMMDSNDIEKECGITILAKNTAIDCEGYHINVADIPGHADFDGEVERVLDMVGCVVLLVDAQEGPMPQTRFVTKKALVLGLEPIAVINKIDKPSARPSWIIDQAFELFDNLGTTDEQLDFPIIYASGLSGFAKLEEVDGSNDMRPLFDAILRCTPTLSGNADETLQLQISQLDYDNYTGRLDTGRILNDRIKLGQVVAMTNHEQQTAQGRVNQFLDSKSLERVPFEEAEAGDTATISGIENIGIGVTTIDKDNLKGLPMLSVDEPMLIMGFMVNTSPLAGTEGGFVTDRQIRDRLQKELLTNAALRMEDTADTDVFRVSGRDELHPAILLESMRRRGFELAVGKPRVVYRETSGQKCEPYENLAVDVPDDNQDAVMEELGRHHSKLTNMESYGNNRTRLEYHIPARGLIGFQGESIILTRGVGLMSHVFNDYAPVKPNMSDRHNDVLVPQEQGEAITYALWNLEDRGHMFVPPNDKIYEGIIIGIHSQGNGLVVNPLKGKKLTSTRVSGTDEAVRLVTPTKLMLEGAVELIGDDELVEITSQSIHLRKRYLSELEHRHHFKELD